jgi:hypothetical protein
VAPVRVASEVRLYIMNASGHIELGRQITASVVARGFDVYGCSNASQVRDETAVVDLRDPQGSYARAVADALGRSACIYGVPLGKRRRPIVEVSLDSTRYVEAMLVVGKDYALFMDIK